jgi:hypothetical protein
MTCLASTSSIQKFYSGFPRAIFAQPILYILRTFSLFNQNIGKELREIQGSNIKFSFLRSPEAFTVGNESELAPAV